MSPEKLAYMANQIGTFFKSQGPERGPVSIAEHISKFWDPRMRRAILAYIETDENSAKLQPMVLQAIRSLKTPVAD